VCSVEHRVVYRSILSRNRSLLCLFTANPQNYMVRGPWHSGKRVVIVHVSGSFGNACNMNFCVAYGLKFNHGTDELYVKSVLPEDGDGARPRNVVFKRIDAAVRPRKVY
jgi:hypothetical protein